MSLIFFSCLYQAAKLIMFCPSSGLYSCPLAMTDGAARTIEVTNMATISMINFYRDK